MLPYEVLQCVLQIHLHPHVVTVVLLYVHKNYYRQFGEFRAAQRSVLKNLPRLNMQFVQNATEQFLEPLSAPSSTPVWRNRIVRWQFNSRKVELLAMDMTDQDCCLKLQTPVLDLRVAPRALHMLLRSGRWLRWVAFDEKFRAVVLFEYHAKFSSCEIVSSSLLICGGGSKGVRSLNRTETAPPQQLPGDFSWTAICAVESTEGKQEYVLACGTTLLHVKHPGECRVLGDTRDGIYFLTSCGRRVLCSGVIETCLIDLDNDTVGHFTPRQTHVTPSFLNHDTIVISLSVSILQCAPRKPPLSSSSWTLGTRAMHDCWISFPRAAFPCGFTQVQVLPQSTILVSDGQSWAQYDSSWHRPTFASAHTKDTVSHFHREDGRVVMATAETLYFYE